MQAEERGGDGEGVWDPFTVDVVATLRDVVALSAGPSEEDVGATWFERTGAAEPLVDVITLRLADGRSDRVGSVLLLAPTSW